MAETDYRYLLLWSRSRLKSNRSATLILTKNVLNIYFSRTRVIRPFFVAQAPGPSILVAQDPGEKDKMECKSFLTHKKDERK